MRVITGKSKGNKLTAPKGLHTRPTADKVKESIFNILGNISNDSLVLDLYSGSGNVGIEFLSRGANKCYFIDSDNNSIKSIKENLVRTKLIDQAYVYKNTVNKAINILSSKGIIFDYIFLDPPYGENLIVPTLKKIDESNILKKDGVIIVEHESKYTLTEWINNLFRKDSRKYGGTTISFYINGRLNNESSVSRNF